MQSAELDAIEAVEKFLAIRASHRDGREREETDRDYVAAEGAIHFLAAVGRRIINIEEHQAANVLLSLGRPPSPPLTAETVDSDDFQVAAASFVEVVEDSQDSLSAADNTNDSQAAASQGSLLGINYLQGSRRLRKSIYMPQIKARPPVFFTVRMINEYFELKRRIYFCLTFTALPCRSNSGGCSATIARHRTGIRTRIWDVLE